MKETLIHMRDKLNDISRRNRSIRLLKLYNKWSFDLRELDALLGEGESRSILEKVIKQSKGEIVLLKPSINDENAMVVSRKLTDLYRNMKGIEDETGVHDFYLGFPFLSGFLSDGTFFQAPLFLYPVRLEKNNMNAQKWVLKQDEGGPQINRTLFLAFKKLNNQNFTEAFFEEAAELVKTHDYQEWLSFLRNYEMHVSFTPTGLKKLKEYKQENIPEVADLTLLENAVIGNFPQGSSSLVKDYDALIDLSEDGDLSLAGELISPNDKEFSEGPEIPNEEQETSENNPELLTLLEADGSQEEIIREARYKKGIVVHGPPGTGKSQVIVNLITDALKQEKKILVVCQKRAALDVVYQRLDSLGLSSHIALVHDEKHDRKKLYSKIATLLEHNQVSHEQAVKALASISHKLASQEELLNSIANALYEYQDYGYRLYDLYGKAHSVGETKQVIELSDLLASLNKERLDDISEKVYTYAEWYDRFGDSTYPLKTRKSFAPLSMTNKLELIELMDQLIQKARKSRDYLESLDYEKITPAYTWLIENKLEKIYPDLNDGNKRTLQGLRLWWWTSFSGKSIIEELLEGEKFKGTNSTEWLKIKKALILMHDLGKETKAMAEELEKLKGYFDESMVDTMKQQISEGDLPLSDLDKMMEYVHRDFEDLQQMDRYWNDCSELERKVIIKLQEKVNDSERMLPDYWVDLFRNSTFVHWIDQTEKKYPQVQKVSTNEFTRIRESFAKLIDDQRKAATEYLIHTLTKNVEQAQAEHFKRLKELKHQVGKKRMIWSLRKLVNEFAREGLVDLMPVWLASPEIVSAIFPLKEGLFDLVIFDEASQCTVESGIPAVYRAKQSSEKKVPGKDFTVALSLEV